jgi:hypothetical protein
VAAPASPRTKTSNNSKRLAANLAIVIPPFILSVIVGMLLSEGCLAIHGNDARLHIEQVDHDLSIIMM